MEKLFTQLEENWNAFKADHAAFIEKGNKAAGQRARKALGEIKKLVTEYRKQSVEEAKK